MASFISPKECLTSSQKKVFFSLVDKELHDFAKSMLVATEQPTEIQRESYTDVILALRAAAVSKAGSFKVKEKKAVLAILDSLAIRDALGIRATCQRAGKALSELFSIPESSSESEVC